ncbi:MAG: type II toxin-antitoxin system HicA family toxin [Candidatus Thermoplasmatota archaeon]|nr:type II toxin-antitoxin system HicA family toxin [Candidatus Thermoplasmatota archaeon]
MSKLPLLTAERLIKILHKIGFKKIRQQGSHVFLRHPDGRSTIVPNHPGEKIDRGLLNKIIKKDLGLSRDEFLKYT